MSSSVVGVMLTGFRPPRNDRRHVRSTSNRIRLRTKFMLSAYFSWRFIDRLRAMTFIKREASAISYNRPVLGATKIDS